MLGARKDNSVVVAVPARNEEDRVVACLQALDTQDGAAFDDIVLMVNNSSDATAAAARAVAMHQGTRLYVVERALPPGKANVGFARRMAMQIAAELAGKGGVLMTTDADGLVDADWLGANLRALDAGVDAVAGWCELHPFEWGALPLRLHEDDARECSYDRLCDEIHGRLDPDPADPLPRHTHHSGASIAVTAAAFARCGGVPGVASGEDRALVAALRRVDAKVRHAPEVHVTVSGRIDGRAVGGMAETIRRRLVRPDEFLDDRLEPALDCARRATCRRLARQAYSKSGKDLTDLAGQCGLAPDVLREALRLPYFGVAWETIEERAPRLRKLAVAVSELPSQMTAARKLLDRIAAAERPAGNGTTDDLVDEEI